MPNETVLEGYAGETVTFDLSSPGVPDLTGETLRFLVASAPGATILLDLESGDGIGGQGEDGAFSATVTLPGDADTYRWACWRQVSGGWVRQAGGALKVSAEVGPPE